MSLVARDVVVKRCSRVVLHGVGFHLPSGSHTVVVGGNGTGKTSLLRVLSGEMRPASGSVLMKGVSVSTVPPAALARHRVFLAQQTECRLPFLARDVVRFGAEARGLRGIAANRAADRAMHLANVAALASRPISQLSGGEQQRIHWARVLAQLDGHWEGAYLFLDEPVSSLDLGHQHELLALVQAICRSGATAVTVLHDLNLSAQYADLLLVLHQQQVEAFGEPSAVLDRDRLRRVFGVSGDVISDPADNSLWVRVDRRDCAATRGVSALVG